MKKYLFVLSFYLFGQYVAAQRTIGASFEDAHTANRIVLHFSKQWEQHEMMIGLSHLFTNTSDHDEPMTFKDQAYGQNFFERAGVQAAYIRNFWKPLPHITTGLGYSLAYTYSGTQHLQFDLFPEQGTFGEELYTRAYVTYRPSHALQHSLFAQMRLKINKYFNVIHHLGVGFASFYGIDERLGGNELPTRLWGQKIEAVAYRLSLGVEYRF